MDSVCDVLGVVFKMRGSVMPRTLLFAVPCAAAATLLRVLKQNNQLHNFFGELDILADSSAYTGFTSALSFLLVFRTSQSYSRYWEGITLGHRMFAEWHDFAASMVAFTHTSKADAEKVNAFRHRLIRLVSIMHATASASLRTMECTHFELIDPDGLEREAMEASTATMFPTTLIGQWLLELVMEGIDEGVVQAPPPIVSRAFQEFSNGMVAFHDGMKLGTTPFPFPYTQITATMLLSHLFVTPFILCTWVLWPTWVFIVTGLVTMVAWALFFTAREIENPFQPGDTRSQYEATRVQKEFNSCLLLLLSREARSIPALTANAVLDPKELLRQRVVHQIRVPLPVHTAEDDDLKARRSTNSRDKDAKRPSFLARLNVKQTAETGPETPEGAAQLAEDESTDEPAGPPQPTSSASSSSRERNSTATAMTARARAIEAARAQHDTPGRISWSGVCPTPTSQSSEFSFGPSALSGVRQRDPPESRLNKSEATLAL